MSKKKDIIEQDILACIFKSNSQCKITKSEQPDFIINYKANGEIDVGIEITELYYDATSARLKNKQNYTDDIINEKYIHKDDKKKLNVKEIKYFPSNSKIKPFNTKMIFLPRYTIDDYRNTFLQTLKKKNKKYENYEKSVNQLALVIYDREDFFSKIKREDFIRSFFNNFIMDEIKNSPFDEIYIVSKFEKESTEFYIQLKYCLLQNELSRLLEYLGNNKILISKIKEKSGSINNIFAEVLIKKHYKNIKTSKCNQMNVIKCNRYSFNINESKIKISVFDDFPKLTHSEADFILNKRQEFFTKKSFNKFLKETKNRYVTFDIGFKVLKNRF